MQRYQRLTRTFESEIPPPPFPTPSVFPYRPLSCKAILCPSFSIVATRFLLDPSYHSLPRPHHADKLGVTEGGIAGRQVVGPGHNDPDSPLPTVLLVLVLFRLGPVHLQTQKGFGSRRQFINCPLPQLCFLCEAATADGEKERERDTAS